MSRYDGLIIPRSYSEYINKTDAATLQQALQLSGVLSGAVAAGDNKAVKSSAVNAAIKNATETNINGIIYNEFIDDLNLYYLSGSEFIQKHLPNLFTGGVFYSLDMTAIEKDTGKYVRVLYNCKTGIACSYKTKEENGLNISSYNEYGTVVVDGNTNSLIQKTKILAIVQNGTYIPLT